MKPTRRWIGPTLLVVALVLGGYATYAILGEPSSGLPLDPASTEPSGTKAIVEIVEELGGTIDVSRELPDEQDDVALVLVDTMTVPQRENLEEWVEAGGTLVLADSSSPLAPDVLGQTSFGIIEATLPRRCDLDVFDDVRRVSAAGSLTYEVPAGATGCFGRGEGSWLIVQDLEDGIVVATGGPNFLTNGTIAEADNALLAVALLSPSPDTRVQFVRPPRPGEAVGGDESLFDLIPDSVQLAIIQLGLAFVVIVLWRMRRLGRPVEELQPVTLAGSELVVAVGDLLQQTGARGRAAQLIRADLRQDLSERLGVPVTVSDEMLAEAVAARVGIPPEEVLAVLADSDPPSDAAVLALAADVERLRERALAPAGQA